MDKKKNITISDIAAAAAVSKATVSRYLNGNYGPMSAETRERIARVIEMSGYQPNSFARFKASRMMKAQPRSSTPRAERKPLSIS